MRRHGMIGKDAVRKQYERLERLVDDPRFLEDMKNLRAHEQAKQPWAWDELEAKEEKRAKQAFDEALARLKEEIRPLHPKNPHRYLSNPHKFLSDDLARQLALYFASRLVTQAKHSLAASSFASRALA